MNRVAPLILLRWQKQSCIHARVFYSYNNNVYIRSGHNEIIEFCASDVFLDGVWRLYDERGCLSTTNLSHHNIIVAVVSHYNSRINMDGG